MRFPRFALPPRCFFGFASALILAGAERASAQFTEVPSTVPVGTWQVEADVAGLSWDRRTVTDDGASERQWTYGSALLTTGLSPRLDVQGGFVAYVHHHYTASGVGEVQHGHGDAFLRAKWNFWGNEAEGPALALLPYVKLPTSTGGVGNDEVEGGVILPFGAPVGASGSVNAQVSLDWVADDWGARTAYLSLSAVYTHRVTEKWGVYGEAAATLNPRHTSDCSALLGGGVTYAFSSKFSCDLAGYAGITREAPDVSAALRIVWVW